MSTLNQPPVIHLHTDVQHAIVRAAERVAYDAINIGVTRPTDEFAHRLGDALEEEGITDASYWEVAWRQFKYELKHLR